MPYLCTQIDREPRKQQRDRDAQADSLSEKKRVWREMHTKDVRRVRCTIRGFSAQASRWNRSESRNTLSAAGPTLSSAHPGESFSSDSAHKQRKPFLPRDGRWINCIMLSQELLFQVCWGEISGMKDNVFTASCKCFLVKKAISWYGRRTSAFQNIQFMLYYQCKWKTTELVYRRWFTEQKF